MVTVFDKIFQKLNFPYFAITNENEIPQLLTSKFSWILIDNEDHHEMITASPLGFIEAFLGTSFFSLRVRRGKNSVLQKECQKLFPSITHELLKVPLCFICQKNSRGERITWLKGYFIVTKYEDAKA